VIAGKEACSRVEAGVLKALSVGFQLPAGGFSLKANCARHHARGAEEDKPGDLPANQFAAVTAVKEEAQGSLLNGPYLFPLLTLVLSLGL
jgi:phage head maturation protease